MDNKFLLRMEKTLKDIKSRLLVNDTIRTLLYYESDEITDNVAVPSIQIVKDHIYLQPIVDTDVTEPFNKKNYIAITLSVGNAESPNTITYAIKISVMCHETCWTYGDNHIRALRIMQEVINDIDGVKFACATKLNFEQLLQTITKKEITGYTLLFSVGDGTGEVDD